MGGGRGQGREEGESRGEGEERRGEINFVYVLSYVRKLKIHEAL